MNSIDGYFETPWVEIDIEQIIAQLAEFDVRWVLNYHPLMLTNSWFVVRIIVHVRLLSNDNSLPPIGISLTHSTL